MQTNICRSLEDNIRVKHNELGLKSSATHTNLQAFSKSDKQNVYDCDQKCLFITSKCVITMDCTINFLNNVTTIKNKQEHLKHVK